MDGRPQGEGLGIGLTHALHHGFFIVKEGWEYNLILAVAAIAVAGTGAGRLSLDYALLGNSAGYYYLHGWCGLLIAVVLGLSGGIGQLAIFYRPLAT
jgi:putative oxidoreductase